MSRKIIDVTTVFDTASILQSYPAPSQDPDHPTAVVHQNIYTITAASNVASGQGTADLVLLAHVGDTICWRQRSLSANTDHGVIIYKIARSGGDPVTDNPKMVVSDRPAPVPDPQNPTIYIATRQADERMTCEVIHPGQESYALAFYVVERIGATFNTIGYYTWDQTLIAVEPSTPKIINVTTVFDTATIVESCSNPSQDPDHPTAVAHQNIYMIAAQANVASGQATADLALGAHVGDTICWHQCSLSGNTDQSVIIYRIARSGGDPVTSNPKMVVSDPVIPVPDPDNPTAYIPTIQADERMTCEVIRRGQESYALAFYVVERDGAILTTIGYYVWDPTLIVS